MMPFYRSLESFTKHAHAQYISTDGPCVGTVFWQIVGLLELTGVLPCGRYLRAGINAEAAKARNLRVPSRD